MSAPKRGKKYKEVLERGCSGYRIWTDWGWENYCEHDYDWECDNCPIVFEYNKYYVEKLQKEITELSKIINDRNVEIEHLNKELANWKERLSNLYRMV